MNRNRNNNCKPNGKGKGGNKPYRNKKDDSEFTRGEFEKKEKSTNDVDWYFDDKEVYRTASRLSFQNFIGRYNIDGVRIPSVCTILTNPSVGVSVKYNNDGSYERSGLNLAAQKLYTKLNIYSGRASNYAPQDVAMAIAGMAELVSYFEYLRRAFGIVLFYNERNRDIPSVLLEKMGIDSDDFYDNQANYRKKFNKCVQSIDQIPLIMNISYIKKAMFMYQRIYTDSQSLMAQMYMFVPATTWIIDETMNEHGTVLKTIDAASIPGEMAIIKRTMGQHLTQLSNMCQAMLNASTLNLVYADIFNLAAKTNEIKLFKMDILSDDYAIQPVYDPMILLQIHNADIMGSPRYPRSGSTSTKYVQRTPFNDVYCNPDDNVIVYNPATLEKTATNLAYPSTSRATKLLDFNSGDPSDEEIVESTRLAGFWYPGTPAADLVDGDGNQLRLIYTMGDHYIVSMQIAGNAAVGSTADQYILSTNEYSGFGQPSNLALMQSQEVFSSYPLFYEYDQATNAVTAMRGDVDFNTQIDRGYLDGINDLVMLAMFNLR